MIVKEENRMNEGIESGWKEERKEEFFKVFWNEGRGWGYGVWEKSGIIEKWGNVLRERIERKEIGGKRKIIIDKIDGEKGIVDERKDIEEMEKDEIVRKKELKIDLVIGGNEMKIEKIKGREEILEIEKNSKKRK